MAIIVTLLRSDDSVMNKGLQYFKLIPLRSDDSVMSKGLPYFKLIQLRSDTA
ncbi:MAG: hypothetical protein NTW54_02395 [Bacteroidetes bacterium]|nr:hypothetical protein [Bacteroidota bacterium]